MHGTRHSAHAHTIDIDSWQKRKKEKRGGIERLVPCGFWVRWRWQLCSHILHSAAIEIIGIHYCRWRLAQLSGAHIRNHSPDHFIPSSTTSRRTPPTISWGRIMKNAHTHTHTRASAGKPVHGDGRRSSKRFRAWSHPVLLRRRPTAQTDLYFFFFCSFASSNVLCSQWLACECAFESRRLAACAA